MGILKSWNENEDFVGCACKCYLNAYAYETGRKTYFKWKASGNACVRSVWMKFKSISAREDTIPL